jgi:UDP-N-acetylmuramoylalanine--D-glutamate ligase
MTKKIGIWGLGIVGKSAIRYFNQRGYTLELLDQRSPNIQEQAFLREHQTPWFGNDQLVPFLERNDLILPSCGIDLRPYPGFAHKWLAELDLFAQECMRPIIAITGSVGKTTVTHLLSHLLRAQGKNVFTGGNIGVGLLESIDVANKADCVIIEVSSFQLERCKTFSPDFAICTNIYANHLDRHGSFENYVQAKMKILGKNNRKILFPLSLFDQIPEEIRQTQPLALFATHIPSSQEISLITDFHTMYYLHNSKLMINYQTKNSLIFDFKELPLVLYPQNAAVLASALHMLGHPLDNFVAVLNEQELPEHRLEKVATINEIDFYNDSKATIPASTLAAIEKIKDRPIVLFLGGVSKGVDRADFVKQIGNSVRFIYCFGKEAHQLKAFCDANQIPAQAFSTLDEAFDALPSLLKAQDQVLFSPAGASFDLFSHYAERGNYFKKLVLELQKII